jgi:hypothetical protein
VKMKTAEFYQQEWRSERNATHVPMKDEIETETWPDVRSILAFGGLNLCAFEKKIPVDEDGRNVIHEFIAESWLSRMFLGNSRAMSIEASWPSNKHSNYR